MGLALNLQRPNPPLPENFRGRNSKAATLRSLNQNVDLENNEAVSLVLSLAGLML